MFTALDIARKLGLTAPSVIADIKKGVLSAEKVGGNWIISDKQAEGYIKIKQENRIFKEAQNRKLEELKREAEVPKKDPALREFMTLEGME